MINSIRKLEHIMKLKLIDQFQSEKHLQVQSNYLLFEQGFRHTFMALTCISRWELLNRLKKSEHFSLFKNHLILG